MRPFQVIILVKRSSLFLLRPGRRLGSDMTGLGSLANIRSSLPRAGGDYKNIAVALEEIEAVVNARFDGYVAGTTFGELGISHEDAWRAFIDERREFAARSCQQRYGDEQFIDNGVQKLRWREAVELVVVNYTRDAKLSRAFKIGWQEANFARTLE